MKRPSHEAHLGQQLGVGERARRRRAEAEDALGAHDRVGRRPARSGSAGSRCARALPCRRRGCAGRGRARSGRRRRRRWAPAGRPTRPTSTSAAWAAGRPGRAGRRAPPSRGRGARRGARATRRWRRRAPRRWRGARRPPGAVARSRSPSRSRLSGGSRKTGTKPARRRRLLRLGPPALPLALEAEAGDDADHGPAPVLQVEERRRGSRRPRRRGGGRHGGRWVPRTREVMSPRGARCAGDCSPGTLGRRRHRS